MIDGRNIIVVGVGGIGRPIARLFVENGGRVVFSSRTESTLVEASAGLPKNQVLIAPVDASDWDQVEELFRKAKTKFGNIDAVVVMVGSWKRVSINSSMQEIKEHGNAHLRDFGKARYVIGMTAQKLFREQGHGLIVNFASHAVFRPELKGNLSYVLGHAWGLDFMLSLREELKDTGVRVTNIAPAIVNTSGNADWLDTEERRAKAVQPEDMGKWIMEHLDDPDIPDVKIFDSELRLD